MTPCSVTLRELHSTPGTPRRPRLGSRPMRGSSDSEGGRGELQVQRIRGFAPPPAGSQLTAGSAKPSAKNTRKATALERKLLALKNLSVRVAAKIGDAERQQAPKDELAGHVGIAAESAGDRQGASGSLAWRKPRGTAGSSLTPTLSPGLAPADLLSGSPKSADGLSQCEAKTGQSLLTQKEDRDERGVSQCQGARIPATTSSAPSSSAADAEATDPVLKSRRSSGARGPRACPRRAWRTRVFPPRRT